MYTLSNDNSNSPSTQNINSNMTIFYNLNKSFYIVCCYEKMQCPKYLTSSYVYWMSSEFIIIKRYYPCSLNTIGIMDMCMKTILNHWNNAIGNDYFFTNFVEIKYLKTYNLKHTTCNVIWRLLNVKNRNYKLYVMRSKLTLERFRFWFLRSRNTLLRDVKCVVRNYVDKAQSLYFRDTWFTQNYFHLGSCFLKPKGNTSLVHCYSYSKKAIC